jgi:hypothetical protein
MGYWKNGTWHGGNKPYSTTYNNMIFDGADVYLGGYEYDNSTFYRPGYLKNQTWNTLTNSLDATRSSLVRSLYKKGNDIYNAGYCMNSSAHAVAGFWKNGAWTSLPKLDINQNSIVYNFVMDGSSAIAAGVNNTSILYSGYWFNSTWTTLTLPEPYTLSIANWISISAQ